MAMNFQLPCLIPEKHAQNVDMVTFHRMLSTPRGLMWSNVVSECILNVCPIKCIIHGCAIQPQKNTVY